MNLESLRRLKHRRRLALPQKTRGKRSRPIPEEGVQPRLHAAQAGAPDPLTLRRRRPARGVARKMISYAAATVGDMSNVVLAPKPNMNSGMWPVSSGSFHRRGTVGERADVWLVRARRAGRGKKRHLRV